MYCDKYRYSGNHITIYKYIKVTCHTLKFTQYVKYIQFFKKEAKLSGAFMPFLAPLGLSPRTLPRGPQVSSLVTALTL